MRKASKHVSSKNNNVTFMNIPFVDLKAQYAVIKEEVDHAIGRVLRETQFVLGPEVERFEQDFAAVSGVKYAVGVNSGTAALFLALLAKGIGRGDEVITQPNSFIATAAAISTTGATPIFVDIDRETHLIDVEKIESAITPQTKAIIPVHLCGQMAPMEKIIEIAYKHDLFVLEDACQAHGAKQKGKSAGSFGHAAAFSFYPGKNLGAYGEAGAVVTNDEGIYHAVQELRDHGSSQKYIHKRIGYNMRMEGIQGAVLNVKLPHLERWNMLRNKHAEYYDRLLIDIPDVTIPVIRAGNEHVFHLYVIRYPKRDALQDFLKKRGIATGIHYPIPIHLQEAYASLNLARGSFLNTEMVAEQILSLPIYPELVDEQIEYVVEQIREFVKRK